MKEYQKRVIEELAALEVKIDRLAAFLTSPAASDVDAEEIDRMTIQFQHMRDYANVLRRRIENF